jgi:RHS repeat-associated protein
VLTDPELRQEIEYDALDRVTEVRRYVPASASTPTHVERYAYNALGGFTLFDGEPVDHQRPRLDGNGAASAGMRATLNGSPVPLDGGGRVTALGDRTFRYFGIEHRLQAIARNSGETRFSYDAFGRPAGHGYFSSSPTQRDSALGYLYNAYSPNISLTVGDSRNPDREVEGVYHQIDGRSNGWIYDGIDHPLWTIDSFEAHYYELDIIGNVRRLHLQRTWAPFAPASNPDLGGYAYTAFGRTLREDEPGGASPPRAYSGGPLVNPYTWQARSTLGDGTLYDFRSRIWSTDLGSFLQPDEYAFLSHGGTLWSWPGQNPFRWRDPSGRIGMDGASTDRAIGAGQNWADPAFLRGLNQGAAAGAAFNALGAAAIFGGAGLFTGAAIEQGVSLGLARLASSPMGVLRWLGLLGTASGQVVKGCADAEAGIGSAASGAAQAPKLLNAVPKSVTNTANHIFGPKSLAEHRLGPVLEAFGGDAVGATYKLQNAAQALANRGAIKGVFQTTVDVAGQTVTVRGAVIDGVVNLRTAFIP